MHVRLWPCARGSCNHNRGISTSVLLIWSAEKMEYYTHAQNVPKLDTSEGCNCVDADIVLSFFTSPELP